MQLFFIGQHGYRHVSQSHALYDNVAQHGGYTPANRPFRNGAGNWDEIQSLTNR